MTDVTSERLTVTADDRSGAMEAAALCADAGWTTVVVSVDGEAAEADCVVVDLRSRHLSPERAAERVRATRPVGRWVHKIDSTLRGNWAAELRAVGQQGVRVLLVPAYPAAGRTCEDGVVRVHGTPVHETEFARDAISPVRSSRPVAALPGAVELRNAREVAAWATAGTPWAAVTDAASDHDIDAAVAAVGPEVVVAGPAAVVGSVARRGRQRWAAEPALPVGEVLVVCGSRHPASRAQAAAAAGLPGVTVLSAPDAVAADPEVVALELAVRAHDHLASRRFALVVLLGGDTADAFLGRRPVRVSGTVGVGMALGTTLVDGRVQALITKPGAFGATNALVDLLSRRNQ